MRNCPATPPRHCWTGWVERLARRPAHAHSSFRSPNLTTLTQGHELKIGGPTTAAADAAAIQKLFPTTYGQNFVELVPSGVELVASSLNLSPIRYNVFI